MSEVEDQGDQKLLQRALQSKHIRNDSSSLTSPFHCDVCNKPFSGTTPLIQHLLSAKHQKKALQRDSVAAMLSSSSPEVSLLENDHREKASQETSFGQDIPQISDVKDALAKGYIVEDKESTTSPYQCKLCQSTFSGLAPLKEHIKSAKHIKKASAAASIHIGTSSTAVSHLGEPTFVTSTPKNQNTRSVISTSNTIQESMKKGHVVENLGSSTHPYQCKLCNVPLTGLAPLEEHIQSAKHLRNVQETYAHTDSPDCSFEISNTELPSPQHHSAQPISHSFNQETSTSNEADVVSKSFELGHVRCDSGSVVGAYFCEVCQAPLSGDAPLRQHVTSPNHAKKLRTKGVAFDMSGMKNALLNIDIPEEVSPIVKQAIEAGYVSKDESSTSGAYVCNICQVPLTGMKPVEQHLQGTNHLMRAKQTDNLQILPVTSPTITKSLITPSSTPEPVTSPTITKSLITPSTPETHIWAEYRVIPCETPKQPDEHTYKNLSNPRGNVYIFNNTFQNDHKYFRPGADCDTVNLKYVFGKMGYKVYINRDLSREETFKKLDEIQKEKELEKVDSFIMVILSHGKDDKIFYANDMELIHIDDIRYKFMDGKCSQLKGKPKIFLFNFCRGDTEQRHLQTDAPQNYPDHEAPSDMITLHASIDGFMAKRDATKGTIFVQALCETLSKHAHNTELLQIYHILSNIMKESLGTTPELQNYLFKKFNFNPVHVNN